MQTDSYIKKIMYPNVSSIKITSIGALYGKVIDKIVLLTANIKSAVISFENVWITSLIAKMNIARVIFVE